MTAAVLHDVLSAAVRQLRDAGLDPAAAAADVEVLARHVLGWDRARLLAHRRDPAPPAFVERFAALIERRVDRVPVAYLTGTREFYGLDFEVTPAVLIPRPETELAVDVALDALPSRSGGRAIDVGTGSGCIAVALAVARPGAAVVAVDRSAGALRVARRNARRHGVDDRVAFILGDLLTALAPRHLVDVVVSNPPYVPDGSPDVAVDVARHEPASALYAGPDGLDVVRRLLVDAARVVRPGGRLVVEIGVGQAEAVSAAAAAHGAWAAATFRDDLQGIARVAVLSRLGAIDR
ncbi:MAG: peptide chain release factor N(5)-glutamine methyltransferase [Vicinamibacteraceae bacterium]